MREELVKLFMIVFMIGSILYAIGGGIWSYGMVFALYVGTQQWIIFIKREIEARKKIEI